MAGLKHPGSFLVSRRAATEHGRPLWATFPHPNVWSHLLSSCSQPPHARYFVRWIDCSSMLLLSAVDYGQALYMEHVVVCHGIQDWLVAIQDVLHIPWRICRQG